MHQEIMLNLSAPPYISSTHPSTCPSNANAPTPYYYHPSVPWQQPAPPAYMQQPTPPSSSNLHAMNIPSNHPLLQEEITTIFVVGFPNDMHEREFQNMFIFSPGFEAATIKIPTLDELDQCVAGQHKKQIIGFAKFRTRLQALEARDILSGRKVDAEKGSVLKAEMAKKNLHTKRGLSNEFFHPAFQQYGIINMQLSANAHTSGTPGGVPAYTGATTGTGTLFTQPPITHQQINHPPPPTLESLFAPSVVNSPKLGSGVENKPMKRFDSPNLISEEDVEENSPGPRALQQQVSISLPGSPVLLTDPGKPGKMLSINTSLANRWIHGLAPATATAILTNPIMTPTPSSPMHPAKQAPPASTSGPRHGAAAVYFPKDKLPSDLITQATALIKDLPGFRRILTVKDAVLIEFDAYTQATAARHWGIHVLDNVHLYQQNILVVTTASILDAAALGGGTSAGDPNVVAANQLLDLSRSATL